MRELIRHILREHNREIDEMKKLTTSEFIEKAKSVHGDKYDYSKVNYETSHKPVTIICPTHGPFPQKPNNHLSGKACPKCAKVSDEDFIKRAQEINQDENGNPLYDYSDINFKGMGYDVTPICPEHGKFKQNASNHLKGQGCPDCAGNQKSNTKDFVKRAKEIHQNDNGIPYYTYDDVDYINNYTPVQVTCPEHGNFPVRPGHHLKGSGCPKCKGGIKRTQEDFINLAKEIHSDEFGVPKFDYSKVKYVRGSDYVDIICPKHGIFPQTPSNHLSGIGCPSCNESKGEKFIANVLEKNKIEKERFKRFEDCTNKLQGKFCRKLPFDFYLPKYNTCIEFDGQQHFSPNAFMKGDEGFKKQQKLDKLKNQYCKKNGIKLIRIPYTMKKNEIESYILKELGITD